MVYEESKDSLT